MSDNLKAVCYTMNTVGDYAPLGVVDNISVSVNGSILTAEIFLDEKVIKKFLEEIERNPEIKCNYLLLIEFYDGEKLLVTKFIDRETLYEGKTITIVYNFELSSSFE